MEVNFDKKQYLNSNSLFLGVFMLLSATNAFVVFGTLGKYFFLAFGMLFLIRSVPDVNIFFKKNIFTVFKALFYFLVLLCISFELGHDHLLHPQKVSFSLICLLLFFLGVFFKQSSNEPLLNIDIRLILLSSLFIIFSSYKFYYFQSFESLDSERSVGEGLNAVGVAYTHGQLFLIFLWLLQKLDNFKIRIILILVLLSISAVIIFTGSRGALLYLVITLLMFYGSSLKKIFNLKKLFVFVIVLFSAFFLFKDNPVLVRKIDNVERRFTSMISYLDNNNNFDGSLDARKEIQKVFFDKYQEMFFGYSDYGVYPHNQFIEIFMRWGVFGLPLIIVSLCCLIKAVFLNFKAKKNNDLTFLIISVFFFSYLQSMSSLSLEMNRFMWLGFGYLLTKNKNE